MARRQKRLTKAEYGILIGIASAFFLVFVKIVEYSFKGVIFVIQYISNDFNWVNESLKNYNGNWKEFYNTELHKKIEKYIAIILLIIGFFLLYDRLWAGILFFIASAISFFAPRFIFQNFKKNSKELLVACCVIFGIISNAYYVNKENIFIEKEIAREVARVKREAVFARQKQMKIDSSNLLVKSGKEALFKKKFTDANKFLDAALNLDPSNDEAVFHKALLLRDTKKIDEALAFFALIQPSSPNYDEVLVNQGLCLIKKGQKTKAISLFKEALTLNNRQAEKLYNKYNPIKKYIIGYATLCCDGSHSSATGRGACSHHGGVCNWNEPIFQESRKYE